MAHSKIQNIVFGRFKAHSGPRVLLIPEKHGKVWEIISERLTMFYQLHKDRNNSLDRFALGNALALEQTPQSLNVGIQGNF